MQARVVRPALKVLFIMGYAESPAIGNDHPPRAAAPRSEAEFTWQMRGAFPPSCRFRERGSRSHLGRRSKIPVVVRYRPAVANTEARLIFAILIV